jgi:hypothetical protein
MNRKYDSRANKPLIIRRRGRRVLPKLSDEQRAYIIRRLAGGDMPTAIQRDVRARFGIELSPQSIAYYDPTRVPTPKKRWAPLFHAARRERTADQTELMGEARQIERLARRIVEVLEHRVLDGFDAARAVAITDEDRLRALQGFVAKLAVTNPAGLAEIRRALDAPGPHDAAAPADRPRDHEAPIRT